MFSKLRDLFSNNGADREFQGRVCEILRREFPDVTAVASDDPTMIEVGETQIGIANIRSKFNITSRTDDDLSVIVREHYLALVDAKQQLDEDDPSWETASSILMPRLGQFGEIPVLTIPFCGDLRIAFVLDSERVVQYVSDELFGSWEKNIKEVFDLAIANLEARSDDLTATAVPGVLFAVQTMDSFDAARILSPTIRQSIVETLGSPFCFGVPNRDFLVCWPKNAETRETWAIQVKTDFDEQPYPISSKVFECDEQGEITEA